MPQGPTRLKHAVKDAVHLIRLNGMRVLVVKVVKKSLLWFLLVALLVLFLLLFLICFVAFLCHVKGGGRKSSLVA